MKHNVIKHEEICNIEKKKHKKDVLKKERRNIKKLNCLTFLTKRFIIE